MPPRNLSHGDIGRLQLGQNALLLLWPPTPPPFNPRYDLHC
jgi:hypothetical protein